MYVWREVSHPLQIHVAQSTAGQAVLSTRGHFLPIFGILHEHDGSSPHSDGMVEIPPGRKLDGMGDGIRLEFQEIKGGCIPRIQYQINENIYYTH